MDVDRFLIEAVTASGLIMRSFQTGSPTARVDHADANYHAKQVLTVVDDVVPPGNIEKHRGQVPEEYDRLFERIDAEAKDS